MKLRLLICLLLGSVVPAAAQEHLAARMTYAVYAAGLNVMVIDVRAFLSPEDYRVELGYHTTGLFGLLKPTRIDSFAQGRWVGERPAPVRFATWGTVGGAVRRTTLDYPNGHPVVTTLDPPDDGEHEAVPAADRHGLDTLSAMADLVRQVARSGSCDGQLRLFDGRRVMDVTSHTVGMEQLAPDYRDAFSGPALRCDFAGRMLAGFPVDMGATGRARVHHSHAWLAQVVPGEPALPVRITFETRFFGEATAYLTQAEAVPPG